MQSTAQDRMENTPPTLQGLAEGDLSWMQSAEYITTQSILKEYIWKWLHQGREKAGGDEAIEYRREWWCCCTPRCCTVCTPGSKPRSAELQTLAGAAGALPPTLTREDKCCCKVVKCAAAAINIPLLLHQRTWLWPFWGAFPSPKNQSLSFLFQEFYPSPHVAGKIAKNQTFFVNLFLFLFVYTFTCTFAIFQCTALVLGVRSDVSHISNSCKFHHLMLIQINVQSFF